MSAPAAYCDQCGGAVSAAGHDGCLRRRQFEPPRFCAECARRMVVQVTPAGWTARCSQHGVRRAG